MKLIVQKYGGSSLSTPQRIKKVAQRIIKTKQAGYHVIAVVSAPGDTTDKLIAEARKLSPSPPERELDMLLATGEQQSSAFLAMAIEHLGQQAVSLTAPQVGIYTDTRHTQARITRINTGKLLGHLRKGRIVIVTGFQGVTVEDDITTLGRGGSDLTALALAFRLKAESCEIYTDVEGIYTADPRIIPSAQKIDQLSYDELLELAASGAQVMQSRAVEIAKKYNVPFMVRSSFTNKKGTLITGEEKMTIEKPVVTGVSFDKNQAKVSIIDVPDRPGIAARMFGELAKKHINIDMIIQSIGRQKKNDISFTIFRKDLNTTLAVMEEVRKTLKAKAVVYDNKVAKISIVGVGVRTHSGIAARMFNTLARNKINIEMISTSEIKISCIIRETDVEKAARAIHKEFNLGKK